MISSQKFRQYINSDNLQGKRFFIDGLSGTDRLVSRLVFRSIYGVKVKFYDNGKCWKNSMSS
jgi:hypothetical protein